MQDGGRRGSRYALYRTDPGHPARIATPWLEILRTRLLLLAQGWSEHTDAMLLREDPVLRLAVSSRRGDGPLWPSRQRAPGTRPEDARPSERLGAQPTRPWSLEDLSSEENRAGPAAVLLAISEHGGRGGQQELTLDLGALPVIRHDLLRATTA